MYLNTAGIKDYEIVAESKKGVVEVYTEKDFNRVQDIVSEIFDIIFKGYYPKRTKYPIKCIDCCYRNICVQ